MTAALFPLEPTAVNSFEHEQDVKAACEALTCWHDLEVIGGGLDILVFASVTLST